MNAEITHLPRLQSPVPRRCGLFLRVGRNQHRDLESAILLADGVFGLVVDPLYEHWHADLLALARQRDVHVILDPRSQEMSLEGGWSSKLGRLRWGDENGPHSLSDFNDLPRRRKVRFLAEQTVEKQYTGVLSLSHYISSLNDGWLEADVQGCVELRAELRRLNADEVQIFYSLALPYRIFRDGTSRQKLVQELSRAGVDALWFKISNFGSESTATKVENYIKAAADFDALGIPLIADHVGGIPGLSLLAFGAVGGLAHGVTLKERFDANSWLRRREGKPFQPQTRIYVERLGVCLEKAVVEKLFDNRRAKSRLGCPDVTCCPRGPYDTLGNPVRHAVRRRSEEIRQLSRIPLSVRPAEFVDNFVRRTSDDALFVSRLNYDESNLAKRLQKLQKSRNNFSIGLVELAKNFKPKESIHLPKRLSDNS